MKKLKFTVPKTYGDFIANDTKEANNSGIYIWGFKNKGKFIPYYVGKSESSVYKRVKSHFKDLNKNNKYIIFYPNFYVNLKNNLNKLAKVPNPSKNIDKGALKDDLLYLNNKEFLCKKYGEFVLTPDLLKKEFSSQELDSILNDSEPQIQDVIELIFNNENLYISYCIFTKEQTDEVYFEEMLRAMETFVKYKMPNPVISQSSEWNEEYENQFNLDIPF